jgi:hypothetical protein
MTITGMKSVERDVKELMGLMPTPPAPEDEAVKRFLGALTAREILECDRILSLVDAGFAPTDDDFVFLKEIYERPKPPLPEIDPSQPVCEHCHRQPASLRILDFGIRCDDCFDFAGGNFDITKLPKDKNGNYLV